MSRSVLVGSAVLLVLFGGVSFSADTAKELEANKAALQQLSEFIGDWKGDGETKSGKSTTWMETMKWGWRFKGDKAWLEIQFKDSKTFGKGELRFVPEKKKFEFSVTEGNNQVTYEGEFKAKKLVLSRVDEATKNRYILTMSTNNDGARLIYNYQVQTKGKGLEKTLFVAQHKKEGVNLSGGKKNECVVSGGLGTMPVSYNGKTYYVCCSGCADAFRENPKKFVEEFEKKKK